MPDPAPLATPAELATFLQQGTDLDTETTAAAEYAVAAASGVVRRYCEEDFLVTDPVTQAVTLEVPADVKLVALRVAGRVYKNPNAQSFYSYDGVVGSTPVDMSGRILTPDEKMILDRWRRANANGGAGTKAFSIIPT